jgi:hypothetical protein
MKAVKYILILLVMVSSEAIAQTKTTTDVQQVWFGYFNQTRFSNRWGSWLDLHLRTKEDFFTNFSQSIFRGGITYYLNDACKLTVGYAYINHFPADNHSGVSQPEHRPWQQIQWHNKYSKMRTMQWIRLEERFRHKILDADELADGYSFNYRIRHNFLLQVPIGAGASGFRPKTFAFVANNELHINFGKQIVNNYFDQNRFFIGLSYFTNSHDNVQFGYMNVFQQLPAGNQYKSIHAARLFYFHNLDLRKKLNTEKS